MKKINFFIVLLVLLKAVTLYSQGVSSEGLHASACNYYTSDDYCIKLNMHSVVDSNFPQTINNAILNNAVNLLNEAFSNSGITFQWDNSVTIHNNNENITSYSLPNPGCYSANQNMSIFNAYTESSGLSLFFFNKHIGADGATDGVAKSPFVLISNPTFASNNGLKYNLAHNVGHALGLFHLQHGTTNGSCENNDGYTEVPETPSTRCNGGDYVDDTPILLAETLLIGANCMVPQDPTAPEAYGQGSFTADNFMLNPTPGTASNLINCMNSTAFGFTSGQINRMKMFLGRPTDNLSHLIGDCSVSTECSECNKTSNYYAQKILFESSSPTFWPPSPGEKYLELNCNSITINSLPTFFEQLPPNIADCEYEYSLKLPGSSNFVPYQSLFGQTINFTGDSTTVLKLSNSDGDVCCYEINCSTPYTTGSAMNNLQTECPIECDPCDINPSFTYEFLNFCTYRFVANSGTNCEDSFYVYKWYLTRLGFPTYYVGSGQSIDLFVEDYPMLKLVIENTQQNCEVEINQQLLFGCFQLSPNNGTIEQKLSGTNRSITIFPNPSKQDTELRFIGIDYKEVSTIEVYNIIGNIKTIMKPRNNSFKIEKLTSGIYFIRFNTTKGIVQKKLIIE
ncbi:zinc-dependent metalloprotease [Pontimicrobium sp. SW4]|uniref:Zinc-dependent metalloprotease n=1 Tax=Pontimicrobium sp. SW4 TaxID=3153519 RepID=A0AAU7BTY2_9FLAO